MRRSNPLSGGMLVVSLVIALATVSCATVQPNPDGGRRRGENRPSGERPARPADNAPKVGDMAPAFTLKSQDGSHQVSLESYRGKRPVVLFFGSYT